MSTTSRFLRNIFESINKQAGRPIQYDGLIDICGDLQSQCLVPSCNVGKVIHVMEKSLLGLNATSEISTQTAIRAFCIKSISSDIEIAIWLSKQTSLFLLVDGGTYKDRSFIQYSLTGYSEKDGKVKISSKKVSMRFIQVYETITGTTGKEIAEKIAFGLEHFATWQKQIGMTQIFNLTNLTGICYDTTSENTGKINGIGARLEEIRQNVSIKLTGKRCNKLIESKCIDHVTMLIFTNIMKRMGSKLNEIWPNNTVVNAEGGCLVFSLLDVFGNFFNDGHGDHIVNRIKKSNESKSILEKLPIPTFKNIDSTRYLSYGNLAEILVDFDDFIMPYMIEIASIKGKDSIFTPFQRKYWEIFSHPLIHLQLILLKLLKTDWVGPLMKYGNTNYSWNGFALELQKALLK